MTDARVRGATVDHAIQGFIRDVLILSHAKPTGRLVLVALAAHADLKSREAWPGADTLAELCGVSEKCVRENLKILQHMGEITIVTRGGGRGRTTVYRIATASELYDRHRAVSASVRRPPTPGQPADLAVVGDGAQSATDSGNETLTAGGVPRSRVNAVELGNSSTHPVRPAERAEDAGEAAPGSEYTTREHAARHRCPRCGAAPGGACQGTRGSRKQHHKERHRAAIDAGAPVLEPGSGRAGWAMSAGPPSQGSLVRCPGALPPHSAGAGRRRNAERRVLSWANAEGFVPVPPMGTDQSIINAYHRSRCWIEPDPVRALKQFISQHPYSIGFDAPGTDPEQRGTT